MNIYEGNNVQKNIMANQYKPTNTVQKNTTVNQPKTGIFNNPSSQPTAGINKVNNNIHAALGGTMDNKKVGTNGARQTVQNWLNRGNPQNNVIATISAIILSVIINTAFRKFDIFRFLCYDD